jgi:hypothetical protein
MTPLGRHVRSAARWYLRRPWHHQAGIALVAALAVAGIVVATTHVVVDSAGDEDAIPSQTEPPLKERLRIAFRFAPVLRLATGELFFPIDRDAYVRDTRLDQRRPATPDLLVAEHATVATLPSTESDCQAAARCSYVLDVNGLEPPRSKPRDYRALEDRTLVPGASDRVYFHVTRYDDTGDYAVQYWFLYFLNYRLNVHESDWEQITLHLDPDGKPLEAFYSSHASGQKRTWSRMEKVDGHPVVYAALGSHANYFKRGTHAVTLDCRVVLHRRLCSGNETIRDTSDGRGPELRLARDYKLRELAGPVFIGSYGSGNYVLGKRKNEILADPRTRVAWQNPLVRFKLAKRVAALTSSAASIRPSGRPRQRS